MHKEAGEELNVRLKLVVLELANHFGVIKACKDRINSFPILILR